LKIAIERIVGRRNHDGTAVMHARLDQLPHAFRFGDMCIGIDDSVHSHLVIGIGEFIEDDAARSSAIAHKAKRKAR